MIKIDLADQQRHIRVAKERLCGVVRCVLEAENVHQGYISVALVEDRVIQDLHQRFLHSDTTTDVMSFPLNEPAGPLEGEIVVNAQQAARVAARLGCTPEDELLLYVVHGLLHLCGYDDHGVQDRAVMRRRQSQYLAPWGVCPVYEGRGDPAAPSPGEE